MQQDRSVASAFIYVLKDEFVARRHGSVTLDLISERAAARLSVVPRSELAPLVVVLVRRLTEAQAPVFRCKDGHLMLTESAISVPSSIADALRSFGDSLYPGNRPETESKRPPAAQRPESEQPAALEGSKAQEQPAGPSRPVTGAEQSEALDDFFEGFEKDIMKARLGTEGNQERG